LGKSVCRLAVAYYNESKSTLRFAALDNDAGGNGKVVYHNGDK